MEGRVWGRRRERRDRKETGEGQRGKGKKQNSEGKYEKGTDII